MKSQTDHNLDAVADFYATNPEVWTAFRRAPTLHVFDFARNWNLVLPHLKDSRAEAALDRGMQDLGKNRWRGRPWIPSEGPWEWSSMDVHWERAAEAMCWYDGECGDDGYNAEMRTHLPKPDTAAWYQVFGDCHYIAPWAAAIGRLVYPQLRWRVVRGLTHSTAWGRPSDDSDGGILFDILLFEDTTGDEIRAAVVRDDREPPAK